MSSCAAVNKSVSNEAAGVSVSGAVSLTSGVSRTTSKRKDSQPTSSCSTFSFAKELQRVKDIVKAGAASPAKNSAGLDNSLSEGNISGQSELVLVSMNDARSLFSKNATFKQPSTSHRLMRLSQEAGCSSSYGAGTVSVKKHGGRSGRSFNFFADRPQRAALSGVRAGTAEADAEDAYRDAYLRCTKQLSQASSFGDVRQAEAKPHPAAEVAEDVEQAPEQFSAVEAAFGANGNAYGLEEEKPFEDVDGNPDGAPEILRGDIINDEREDEQRFESFCVSGSEYAIVGNVGIVPSLLRDLQVVTRAVWSKVGRRLTLILRPP
eukprot:g13485.t1